MARRRSPKPGSSILDITFRDLIFLDNFLRDLMRFGSQVAIAERWQKEESRLNKDVKRIVRALNLHIRLSGQNKVSRDVKILAEEVADLLAAVRPMLSSRLRVGLKHAVVRIAAPEFIPPRWFAEVGSRLNETLGGDHLEFEIRTRILPGAELEAARLSDRFEFILRPVIEEQSDKRARYRRRLLRSVIVRNDDPLADEGRGRRLGMESIRGRPLFLPPRDSLPGLSLDELFVDLNVHQAASSAEAAAGTLLRRGAVSIAHVEWLDDAIDKQAEAIDIDIPNLDSAQLELLAPGASPTPNRGLTRREKLMDRVAAVIVESLESITERSARAERINLIFGGFDHLTYSSNAPDRDGQASDWRWARTRLEGFRISALGVLRGRQVPIDSSARPYHLYGRVEDDNDRKQYHALWRGLDFETAASDPAPRDEHYSVNLVFDQKEVELGRLFGLWTGRRSGEDEWRPGVGVTVVTRGQPTAEHLIQALDQLGDGPGSRLQRWIPSRLLEDAARFADAESA